MGYWWSQTVIEKYIQFVKVLNALWPYWSDFRDSFPPLGLIFPWAQWSFHQGEAPYVDGWKTTIQLWDALWIVHHSQAAPPPLNTFIANRQVDAMTLKYLKCFTFRGKKSNLCHYIWPINCNQCVQEEGGSLQSSQGVCLQLVGKRCSNTATFRPNVNSTQTAAELEPSASRKNWYYIIYTGYFSVNMSVFIINCSQIIDLPALHTFFQLFFFASMTL